jgi:lysozyme
MKMNAYTRDAFFTRGVLGIDVSHHQGKIDWKRVAKDGIQYAWIKATEGSDYRDPLWQRNAFMAQDAGLRVGGYHFARPDTGGANDPISEADWFAENLYLAGETVASGLPIVLDYETASRGRFPAEEWIARFNARCFSTLGQIPWLYSYAAFFADPSIIPQHTASKPPGIWLADYRLGAPRMPCDAWQHTSQGVVAGVQPPVDLNRMTAEAWEAINRGA